MIFVNSMSDLFHEDVPDEFIDKVFAVMALAKQHTFQILTKRPERMLRYLSAINRENHVKGIIWMMLGKMPKRSSAAMKSPWPLPNVWLGVSVEDQAAADERIPQLLQTPAAVRWISAEPLLGPVDLRFHIFSEPTGNLRTHHGKRQMELRRPADGGLHWVVVGGESGPNARPMHPAWARSLRDQCAAADVPFLFKQWGEFAPREPYASELMESDELCGKWDGVSYRYGKKGAGRLLDGAQHDGYPEKTVCADRNAP